MTVKIRFHKALQRFTNGIIEHEIDADSYLNLMHSCMSIFPDLGKAVKRIGYEKNVTEELVFIVDGRCIEVEEFLLHPPKSKTIVLCPIMFGHGKAGLMIAIGIALVALVLIAPFAAPVVAGGAGIGIGTAAGFTAFTTAGFGLTVLGSVILGIGISLIIQGLLSLLINPPSTSDGGSRAANDMFEGLTITTHPLTPVSLIYGLNRHVGHLISAGIFQNEPELITVNTPRFYLGFIGRSTDNELIVSTDGSTWSTINVTDPVSQPFTTFDTRQTGVVGAVGDDLYVFAYDSTDSDNGAWGYKSTDYGTTWTYFDYPITSSRGSITGKNGLFIGVGFTVYWDLSTLTMVKSTDGVNWSILENQPNWLIPVFNSTEHKITYWPHQDIWMLADNRGGFEEDPSHIYWTHDPINSSWLEEVYSPGLGLNTFIAKSLTVFPNIALIGLGADGSASDPTIRFWYSYNGKVWNDTTPITFASPTAEVLDTFNVVVFKLINGIYYAAGNATFNDSGGSFSSTGMVLLSSNDGVTWLLESMPMKGLTPNPSLGNHYSLKNFDYDPVGGYFYIIASSPVDDIYILRSQDAGAAVWTTVYSDQRVGFADPDLLSEFYIRQGLWPSLVSTGDTGLGG